LMVAWFGRMIMIRCIVDLMTGYCQYGEEAVNSL
jgi:hypothetical protein